MADRKSWRPLWRAVRPDPAADVEAELRYHLEMRAAELVEQGMDPDVARAEAERRFGSVARVEAEVRRLDEQQLSRARRASWLDAFVQDVRYGARMLRRAPVFTLVASLSIALGIAGNATVFSLANAVLFRAPDGLKLDGLVRMYRNHHSPYSYADLKYFRERATSLSSIVGERMLPVSIRYDGEAERAAAALTTQKYFPALGVRMALGRAFAGTESLGPGAASNTVISYRYWQRRLAGDPSVIGRQVQINGRPFTIVGVAGEAFTSSVVGWKPDLWVPLSEIETLRGEPLSKYVSSFYLTARLADGVSRDGAQAQLDVLMQQLARDQPDDHANSHVVLDHMRGVNAEARTPMTIASAFLMVIVLLVLLIACANVANLLLGRAASRRGEFGVRLAIGAGRGRLIRQLITESVLLAMLGGAIGVGVAWIAIGAIARLLPAEIQDAVHVLPDAHVLAFSAVLCLITGVLFGLAPALRASDLDLGSAMRADAGRGGTRRSRLGRALVMAQVAGSLVLLSTAALFLRSLRSAAQIDPGFDARGVLDMSVDLTLRSRSPEEGRIFYRHLLERAAQVPGVERAALSQLVPLSGSNQDMTLELPGETRGSSQPGRQAFFNVVGTGYFATLRMPIVRGREFVDADRPGTPLVAVVNETAARQLWPNDDPLGHRIHWADDSAGVEYQVVGVARDGRYNSLGEDTPAFVYMAFAQNYRDRMTMLVRTSQPFAGVFAALRRIGDELDPTLPAADMKMMKNAMSLTLLPAEAGAGLLGAFGMVALVLAATGIFGVTSYAVAQRTREMGIRAALGATARDILSLVIGEMMRTVGIGLAIGVLLATSAGLAMTKLLYGVTPVHPLSLLGMPLVLAAVAVLAAWLPARRAAGVDPVVAMRSE